MQKGSPREQTISPVPRNQTHHGSAIKVHNNPNNRIAINRDKDGESFPERHFVNANNGEVV